MTIKLTKEDIKKMIEAYRQGDSTIKLGNQFVVSPTAIYGLLKKKEIPMRSLSHSMQKYDINENYFEIIDTEEKAYWLGFICADGYINFKRNNLVIGLAIKDKKQLQKLKDCLKSNHPIKEYIYDYLSMVRLFIGNKKIVETLKKYISEHKTFSLTFPTIDKRLERHFIRGYFDGDGSVINVKNPQINITSNIIFLDELDIRFKDIGLNKTKRDIRHKQQNKIQTLRFVGRNNLRMIYDYLYKNATIFMDRKKEIFEKIESERPIYQERRCSIIDCDKKYYSLGLCRTHHYQEYDSIKRKERYQKYGK